MLLGGTGRFHLSVNWVTLRACPERCGWGRILAPVLSSLPLVAPSLLTFKLLLIVIAGQFGCSFSERRLMIDPPISENAFL